MASDPSLEVGARLFGRSGIRVPYAEDRARAEEVLARLTAFVPGGVAADEAAGAAWCRIAWPPDGPAIERRAGTFAAAVCAAALALVERVASRPFVADERELLGERRGYSFAVVDAVRDRVQVEVLCLARRRLPVLTLGVRARDHSAGADVAVGTAAHEPGTACIYEVQVPGPGLSARDLEVYPLPIPEPADRLRFLELAPLRA